MLRALVAAETGDRTPITGIACCARAVSGHAVAMLPRMNARRFTR
jgi:hypothetical protein